MVQIFVNLSEDGPKPNANLLETEPRAFENFKVLMDRSGAQIAEKVSGLIAKHPGAYDACVGLLAEIFAKDRQNIQGGLTGYFLALVGKYRQDPAMIETFKNGQGLEVNAARLSDTSLISCKFRLDKSGEYQLSLTFAAPAGTRDEHGDVLKYVIQA